MSSLASAQGSIYVTEFLARNETGLVDEDGEHSDWIEIYNGAPVSALLGGWGLSDDVDEPFQWTFPSIALGPGEYLVVFASDKDRSVPGAPLHTNFKLSGGGEYLSLTKPNGQVSTEFAPEYPPQANDVSYGLGPDLVTQAFFDPPTPGQPNVLGPEPLEIPEADQPHGIVDAAFDVALSHPDPAATIYYTLDGSEPDATGLSVSGPISVKGTTTLRARAFAKGALPSPTLSLTWIFPADLSQQSEATALARGLPAEWVQRDGVNWRLGGLRAGSSYGVDAGILGGLSEPEIADALRSLPNVSVQMHPDDLFGYKAASGREGIYANSALEGDAWERSCSLEWIEPDGSGGFTIDCGTSIQGGTSTAPLQRNQLSMALKFKSSFGPSKLEYDVFPGSGPEEFDYLVLDAGHQLSVNGPYGFNRKSRAQETRDEFVSDLVERMGHLQSTGRWVHLHLNGLYWGVYYLHERPDERFAADHGGGADEEYDWVKLGEVLEGNANDVSDPEPGLWAEVLAIAGGGLAPGALWNGEDAYTALAARVDLVNYVDYLLANWYAGNRDWPFNNWMATARARLSSDFADVNADGKFRFHSWDAESTLYWGQDAEAVGDGIYDRTDQRSTDTTNAVFIHTAALANPDYVALIRDRAQAHLDTAGGALWVEPGFDSAGTIFDPAMAERNVPASLYEPLVSQLAPAIALEYARWRNYWIGNGQLITPQDWEVERDRLLNDYFPIRSQVLRNQLEAASPALRWLIDVPIVSQESGVYPVGSTIELTPPPSLPGLPVVLYRLDGLDPRDTLGAVRPGTATANGPIDLPRGVSSLQARVWTGTEWGARLTGSYATGVRVVINEIQASNGGAIADGDGEFDDWFEIVNLAPVDMDISGFTVTDDLTEPDKHVLPEGTVIPARGRLLLWADDDLDQGPDHVGFKLSAGGEELGLFAPAALGGGLVDGGAFQGMPTGHVRARLPDGRGRFVSMSVGTPGTRNFLPEKMAR